MDEFGNSVTTRLLTLLNVSATKIGKRKRPEDEFVVPEKHNTRRISFADADIIFGKKNKKSKAAKDKAKEPEEDVPTESGSTEPQRSSDEPDEPDNVEEVVDEEDTAERSNLYDEHFGTHSKVLSESARVAAEQGSWKTSREQVGRLGSAIVSVPENAEQSPSPLTNDDILDNFKTPFRSRQSKGSKKQAELQNDMISSLATRKDIYITSSPLDKKRSVREAVTLHALNHITKKRRRVLKNNERLAKASKTNPDAVPPEDVQDQGFTRPSVLILLPFRSSAVDWFWALASHTPSPSYQIENQSRFLSEYGLPDGVVDKLASAEPGTYPTDHVDTFKGNVDDNFRLGIKLTRKTIKMFADFYGCDIIIASPLGLRRSIEKEKNGDYLSSIEMLIIDQMDALTMQNWGHFVMSHINQLPKESHDTDFSRIKPWYLDGHAQYLRQSVLLTAYETAETRSLYSALRNLAGRIRIETNWRSVDVPAGIDPNFVHFDSVSPTDEPEKRFSYFTTQLLPNVLKSAVQSTNTIIFIPSSFDFIRVQNYFRKYAGVTYTVLSEYSTNPEISRARLAFFKGEKSFLLVSERFHFYKRYKIRGARNIIFYGPPDHPQFFTELLSFPFLDEGVHHSDITCKALFSKYDKFKLERILGTEAALELIKAS